MPDHYQEDPNAGESPLQSNDPPAYFLPDLAGQASTQPAAEGGLTGGPHLLAWLILIVVAGGVSLVFNLQEAAFLVMLSGLFVAAQAADLSTGHRPLYWSLTWIVPIGGAVAYAGFALLIAQGEQTPLQIPMVALSVASALACLLTILPPVSNGLVRVFFRGEEPSHSLRLAARICLMILLLALPGWYAFKDTLVELFESTPDMFEQVGLGTGLIGYITLALAAVGFMVRRNLPETLERLGVRPLSGRDWVVIPLGIMTLLGVNYGLEALQHVAFPDLWESDQRVTALIAGQLSFAQVIMLGLSAGVGEEITLRGALQPKLGLWLTALMFAALHVQYSWYGMGVIFIFGLLLGIIRNRTSTTVVILIHMLYDVVVIFAN